MNLQLRIGELARRAQCPAETIRYYEREGLLAVPIRTAGNYRVYGHSHLERLSFIRNCRSLDMTLDEIRQLLRFRDLPQENCDAAHALLDDHINHVAERIAELENLKRQLKALRRKCQPARVDKDCAILDGLGQGMTGDPRKRRSVPHVRGTHRR